MKKSMISSCVALFLCALMSSAAFAEGYRVVIKDSAGKQVCTYDQDSVNCENANLRYETQMDGKDVSCLYEDNQYVDCLPYEDHDSPEWIQSHSGDNSPQYFEPYRVVINDENGRQVCEYGADYVTCGNANLRYNTKMDGQEMSCLYEDGQYVDCLPYEDHMTIEWIQSHPKTEQTSNNAQVNVQPMAEQQAVSYEQNGQASLGDQNYSQNATDTSYYTDSSSGLSYWDNDYDIPNGLTWGVTIGWFGQVSDGDLTQNGFSFGGDLGYKWTHFGVSLDMDLSVSMTDEAYHDLWTYSVHGLVMAFFPLGYGIEQTIGLGAGYTGWSLDYEYTTRTLQYDWYNDVYYSDDTYHGETIDSGGFLSLKLKTRMDFVFEDMTLGLEFDWIPWLDLDHGGKLVNSIIGIQLHVGGID